jgi:hypothetical protein
VREIMHRTAEVRWFFAGPVPRELCDWFTQGRGAAGEPRTDEYLRFPSAFVGAKFREGNFEIKALTAHCGTRAWSGARGRVQRWVKWSCSAPPVAALRTQVTRERPLIVAVTKARVLRRFAFAPELREVPADTRRLPADGCNAELTMLRVARAQYWTFGLEAFAYAHPTRIDEFLDIAAEHILNDPERPRRFHTQQAPRDSFAAANSLSYPEWLETL